MLVERWAATDGMLSHPAVDTRRLYRFLAVQLFCVIFLQKLAVPVPGIPPLSVPMLVMLASLAGMMQAQQLWLSPVAFGVYALFAAAALFSHTIIHTAFSLPSLLLLLVLNLQLVVAWPVQPDFYKRVLRLFLTMMLLPAGMVFVQLGTQIVLGLGQIPSIEPLIPHPLLLPGYIYSVPYHFGASFVRPNGFFMLEPSYISAMLCISLIIEMMAFRRPWYMLLFLAALLGTVAATGLIMLAVAAPFVLIRQSPRFLAGVAVVAALAVAVALPLGVADEFLGRTVELGARNSSASERLVQPAAQLVAALGNSDRLVTGLGAGNLDEGSGSAWPLVKLAQEYGLLTMGLYLILFLMSLQRCPNLPLKLAMILLFQFTGGYLLNPIMCEVIVLLCTILQPTRAAVMASLPVDVPDHLLREPVGA